MSETEHRFGGAWTEIKLKVLRDYLHFYTQALKEQPFKLMYIDAFAGTGDRSVWRIGRALGPDSPPPITQ